MKYAITYILKDKDPASLKVKKCIIGIIIFTQHGLICMQYPYKIAYSLN